VNLKKSEAPTNKFSALKGGARHIVTGESLRKKYPQKTL